VSKIRIGKRKAESRKQKAKSKKLLKRMDRSGFYPAQDSPDFTDFYFLIMIIKKLIKIKIY
jgi:hypothetical protein